MLPERQQEAVPTRQAARTDHRRVLMADESVAAGDRDVRLRHSNQMSSYITNTAGRGKEVEEVDLDLL